MFRRREPIPFAFIAEADRFRSDVTPPPRQRASRGELAGRMLLGLTVAAGLVGSLILGMPALSTDQTPTGIHQSEAQKSAANGR
ncbi:hypothetical protein [Streptomyces odontomachi]|uniref:hypothetical protein n=1 Tax=Streptomyces odontomachi TaxID=2944940 RepID=UPI00210BFE59|nr:hypothetical protein [Streptomyces sp. ODS25]